MLQKLGFGTAAIGRPHYINIRQVKAEPFESNEFKQNGVAILEHAYQQGIRYFDTAPGYGIAEDILRTWLATKDDNTIEVATKWGYTYTANFDRHAEVHEVKDHSIDQLKRQWAASKALAPFVSTLQIHSATFDTGVLEDEKVLNELARIRSEEGIRIGLTSTGDNQDEVLEKAITIERDGTPLFEAYQVTFNVLDQSVLEIAEQIVKAGHRLIIKEGLANGRLFPNENFPQYADIYTVLEDLSKKYQVGIDAIALQFCHQKLNPFIVLSGAAVSAHIDGNLQANSFELTNSEMELLTSYQVLPMIYWMERKQLGWN